VAKPESVAEANVETSTPAKAQTADSDNDKKEDKNWITIKSNFFDFDETLLHGKYRTPNGLMLQGRKTQEKKQMVTLRKDFKTNIQNSRAAVRSITP